MSPSLADRTGALAAALDAGEGRLPAPVLERGRAVVDRVGDRAGLSAEHTVVALAGATGSGKSSLFNAVVGQELARPGVQRPTTDEALAAVRGAGAEPLLDWLGVRRRHELPEPAPSGRSVARGGVVLLDLPDHDSVVREHRLRSEHLIERVDLLVWVVDPQKYADAALHERYLRPLSRHADVVVLVLNQADRLAPAEVDAVLGDLRRLAAEDGLPGVRTLAVSARTGQGMDALRDLLDDAADRREAATRRLTADVEVAARAVLDACGEARGGRRGRDGRTPGGLDALTDALADAAGVPLVVQAVRRAAVRRATAKAGWPPVRWLQRFRPDPLRRLHLGRADGGADVSDRTSLPTAGPATRAAAASAVRRFVDASTAGVPDAWALAVRDRVGTQDLADDLDRAVAGTPLLAERPAAWARAVGVLQAVLLAAAVAGALWLTALAVMAYLRLPEPRTPEWGPFPVPTALLAGGLLAGALLAVLSAVVARAAAARRARLARVRLHDAVERVARARVAGPAAEVLADLTTCRDQAARAAGDRRR
ncbi:GTPase [Cellulomonas endometrii]|uniref:GTPase n=1 Tax=Cellulomonas endometrii TaxID=3036301 RepID=UPI0024AE4DAE|nr:GTPase [Cellulomonas endometrii]